MTRNREFALPDLGEGLTEAEIATWHVMVGDTVAVNDPLAEVETAKALVEIPSPEAGVIARLHAEQGQTVDVGAVIVSFTDTADVTPGADRERRADHRQEVLVGYGPARAQVARRPRKPGYRNQIDTVAVRRRIDAADGAAPAQTRCPIKGVRKATADAMVRSAFTAPHVTEWLTVDITESLRLLDEMRTDPTAAYLRLTPLVLVMRAMLSAVRNYPDINASWDGEAEEIVRYRDVNLGVAVATPRGLLVPNIKAAQTLSTAELCTGLADLVRDARAGKTAPDTLAGGTLTVTNIGVFGVDGATPIVNPGEAAILCVGRIVRRPWEHHGDIALRSVCTLALSFDHRLVDGQLGSQVLAHVAGILERPALALIT